MANTIKVLRLPPRKILRVVHLGLTFGFLLSASAVLFYQDGQFFTASPFLKTLILLFLFLATYFGGWTAAGVVVIWLITTLIANESAIKTLTLFYGAGFLFGAMLAQLYNYIVYWLLLCRKQYKVAFFFDPERKVNIIKSPIKDEVVENWANDEEKEKHKLYNYKVTEVSAPFTITIVANPAIRINDEAEEQAKVETDPINGDINLFLLSVDKALHSFEIDPVLGRPEIWSRVRVIAIFDPELQDVRGENNQSVYLVKPFEFQLELDKTVQSENILAPAKNMWSRFDILIEDIRRRVGPIQPQVVGDIEKIKMDTDILFTFSANPDYVRSSALYANGNDDDLGLQAHAGDKTFTFEPILGANSSVILNNNSLSLTGKKISKHEEGVLIPGKVALNVLTATRKTYIHEFAHALSSTCNGMITDEYYDTWETDEDPPVNDDNNSNANLDNPFYVNRLERKLVDKKIIAIPRTFVNYNDAKYESDINHPSGEENWLGYFPERKGDSDGCIMDRTYGSYQFDDLLSQSIYDRMMTKINRKANRS